MIDAKPRRQALVDLLERVKGATADKQWAFVRDAARLTLDIDDLARSRINGLCDAGGFTDAVLMLVERLLPLAEASVWRCVHRGWGAELIMPGGRVRIAGHHYSPTPALALLTALLSQEEDA